MFSSGQKVKHAIRSNVSLMQLCATTGIIYLLSVYRVYGDLTPNLFAGNAGATESLCFCDNRTLY